MINIQDFIINNINNNNNNNEKKIIKNDILYNNKNNFKSKNKFNSLNNNNKLSSNNFENLEYSNLFFQKKNNLKTIVSFKINNNLINLNYSNEKLNIKNIKKFMTEINSMFLKKLLTKINNYNNSLNITENSNSFSNYSYKNINFNPLINLNNNYINNNNNNNPIDIFYICNICEKYNMKNKIIVLPCDHKICNLCFKTYFENKIKKKEFVKANCPFFFCKKEFNLEILKENINIYLYSFFLKNNEMNNNLKEIENGIVIKNNIEKTNKEINNLIKKNVQIISNKNNLIPLNKKIKKEYCSYCYNKSIFEVPFSNFLKCLNCLKIFCKYCYKEIKNNHFEKFSDNYCRMYSIKNKKYLKRNKKINNQIIFFLFNFGLSIINYFLIFFGVNLHIKYMFKNFKVLYYLYLLCFQIYLIIFFILILPYFPIINLIIDIFPFDYL